MFVVADLVERSWATGDAARPRPSATPAKPATVPLALRVTDVALGAARVSLQGRVTTGARVSVRGRRARVLGDRFLIGIPLKDGMNRLTITARKAGASGATARLTVRRPAQPATTTVTSPTPVQPAAPPSTAPGVQPSGTAPATTSPGPTPAPTTSVPRRLGRFGRAPSPPPAAPKPTLASPRSSPSPSAPAPSPAPPKASPNLGGP